MQLINSSHLSVFLLFIRKVHKLTITKREYVLFQLVVVRPFDSKIHEDVKLTQHLQVLLNFLTLGLILIKVTWFEAEEFAVLYILTTNLAVVMNHVCFIHVE